MNIPLESADMVHATFRTEQISETTIEMHNKFWHIIDVAGQVEKRTRWTTYFEDYSVIVFILSSAGYCQVLEEDGSTNRLMDALGVFCGLLVNPILKPKNMIIFLNKIDLLDSFIKKYQIRYYLDE